MQKKTNITTTPTLLQELDKFTDASFLIFHEFRDMGVFELSHLKGIHRSNQSGSFILIA